MDTNVFERLLNERNRLNLSQKDVAVFLAMSTKQIGRWEGKSAIPTDKLIELAEIGFDIQYILMGKRAVVAAIEPSNMITIDHAVEVAEFAAKEAILTVKHVRKMQGKLIDGSIDAMDNLSLITRAAGILARCEITGDIEGMFEKVSTLAISNEKGA
jgi:transcriptional regulator with XRE-family HTH domain